MKFKMRKPPIKPKKPVRKNKYEQYNIDNDFNLQQIIDEINNNYELSLTPKDINIETESCDSYDGCCYISTYACFSYKESEENFAKREQQYKKDLEQHNLKLKEYNEWLEQNKENIENLKKQQKEKQNNRILKQKKQLEKQLQKLEKELKEN